MCSRRASLLNFPLRPATNEALGTPSPPILEVGESLRSSALTRMTDESFFFLLFSFLPPAVYLAFNVQPMGVWGARESQRGNSSSSNNNTGQRALTGLAGWLQKRYRGVAGEQNVPRGGEFSPFLPVSDGASGWALSVLALFSDRGALELL